MMIQSKNSDSINIINLIKPDTVGAEIGVWKGYTSLMFLSRKIKKLFMIDPYAVENYEYLGEEYMQNFYAKYSKLTGEFSKAGFMRYYDKVYEDVVEKVKTYSAAEICRMTSDQWFERNKDIKLDWVYIDGDHSYPQTKKDLNNSFNVVKSRGRIIGDDYKWPEAKSGKDGTTKAVNEFIEQNKFKMYKHGETQFSIVVP